MAQIIPTIIAKNIKEVEEKVRLIEDLVPLAQLDIMDGRFVAARTWNNPEDLTLLATPLRFEADLMVANPEREAARWSRSDVVRIFVQVEPFLGSKNAEERIEKVSSLARAAGKEFGLTLNPETPFEEVLPFIGYVDRILFRGGTPGQYGSPFQEHVVAKIQRFHAKFPSLPLAIDGGVTVERVKLLKEAGVSFFSVGSAIWNAPDSKSAIEELQKEAAL